MSSSTCADAAKLIETLGLMRHPEGGWYRETYRSNSDANGRARATAILFLLEQSQSSHWHRVDADEMWLWQAGDPLELLIAPDDTSPPTSTTLGPNPNAEQVFQGLVPAGQWQAARPAAQEKAAAGYTLVSCVVTPGFDFAGFELAPPGWEPGSDTGA